MRVLLLVVVVVGVLLAWMLGGGSVADPVAEAVADPVADPNSGRRAAGDPPAAAAGDAGSSRPGPAEIRAAVTPDTALRIHASRRGADAASIRFSAWARDRERDYWDWDWEQRFELRAEAVTAADGTVVLAVPPGRYSLRAVGAGVATDQVFAWYDVRAGELRDVALELPEPAGVTGRILDAQGRPLPGARVRMRPPIAFPVPVAPDPSPTSPPGVTTDHEGRFAFTGRMPGRRQLLFDAARHAPSQAATGDVAPGTTLDLGDVRMSAGVDLRGRVLGAADAPLAGARVRIAGEAQEDLTDAAGRFELQHVAADAHLEIQCDGYIRQSVHLAKPSLRFWNSAVQGKDPAQPLDIRMHASLRLRGAVEGPAARIHTAPIQILVHSYATRTCWASAAVADAAGRFLVRDLYAGLTEVQAFAPGYGYSEPVELHLSEPEHRIELRIVPARGLWVRVEDDGGSPVANATVKLAGDSDDEQFRCIFDARHTAATASTDERGRTVFRGVLNGSYKLDASAPGHLDKKLEFELDDDLQEKVVRIGRAARLQVLVDGVPPELRELLRVVVTAAGAEPDGTGLAIPSRQPPWESMTLRDAAYGVPIPPGRYSVALGTPPRASGVLGSQGAPGQSTAVELSVAETSELRLAYRPLQRIHGRLFAPGLRLRGAKVYGMRPAAWADRKESAHFLDFCLNVYASAAACDDQGSFRFVVSEPGRWLFVAELPGAPIPLRVGVVDVDAQAELCSPVFPVPTGRVRGRLAPGFRGADRSWPRVLIVPGWLAEHDPHFVLNGGIAPPATKTQIEMFGLWPEADGSFDCSPLAPGPWSLTVRAGERLLAVRQVTVGADPVDLPEIRRPAAGPLEVRVTGTSRNSAAVLRPAGAAASGEATAGAFLGFAACEGGVLRFGSVPFGRYRLEIHWSLFGATGIPTGQVAELEHRAAGPVPASIAIEDRPK